MEVKRAVELFLESLSVQRSDETVRAYSVPLTRLAEYATMEGEGVSGVNPGRFMATCAKHLGQATIAKYLVALSQFGKFLNEEELLTNGLFMRYQRRLNRVRGRSPARKIPSIPTEAEFQAVLEAARADTGGTLRQNLARLRNIALLETLRSTGCRVAEVVSLRCGDLAGNMAVITGKGDKQRVVFFDEQAMGAIETYLALRESSEASEAVFARHDRRAKGIMPMSTTSVRNVINTLAEAAGIDPDTISPHKFRHRFASAILEATGNLAAVQDFLGHSSPATTRIYAQLATNTLAGLHESVSL